MKRKQTKTKKKERPSALLCALVAESGEPSVQSFIDHCDGCGKGVWRARSSPSTPPAICRHCFLMGLQAGKYAPLTVGPLNKRQRAELLRERPKT